MVEIGPDCLRFETNFDRKSPIDCSNGEKTDAFLPYFSTKSGFCGFNGLDEGKVASLSINKNII
jgi:hypothetical protein